jgi:hypothetical protein
VRARARVRRRVEERPPPAAGGPHPDPRAGGVGTLMPSLPSLSSRAHACARDTHSFRALREELTEDEYLGFAAEASSLAYGPCPSRPIRSLTAVGTWEEDGRRFSVGPIGGEP